MKFGLPYMGSKSQIARWIIDNLPGGEIFVDLFAGGCAITHAAMVSGKYKRFIANDKTGIPLLFQEAINGELNGFSVVPTKAEFFSPEDLVIKMLYSFGSDRTYYLWNEKTAKLKIPASKMLIAPSLHERRMYYMQFIRELQERIEEALEENKCLTELSGLKRLEGLERIDGLEKLKDLFNLEVVVSDYRNVNIPKGAVVYADPPYRSARMIYGDFNFDEFDDWLNTVDFPVYVSEYDAPRGCVCIAQKERFEHVTQHTSAKKTERIFVQERFAKSVEYNR